MTQEAESEAEGQQTPASKTPGPALPEGNRWT